MLNFRNHKHLKKSQSIKMDTHILNYYEVEDVHRNTGNDYCWHTMVDRRLILYRVAKVYFEENLNFKIVDVLKDLKLLEMFKKYPHKRITLQIYVIFKNSQNMKIVNYKMVACDDSIDTLSEFFNDFKEIASFPKIVLYGGYDGCNGKTTTLAV